MGLTGVWTDSPAFFGKPAPTGLLFYMLESGNHLRWAGERRDLKTCHVFTGLRKANQPDGPWIGRWTDVPKGNQQGSGRISVAKTGPNSVTVTSLEGDPFGATSIIQTMPGGHLSAKQHPEFFKHRRERYAGTDLTGRWRDTANPDMVYYVRQLGSEVYWLEENAKHLDGFCAVFQGEISGTTLTGSWIGIPKGDSFNGAGDGVTYRTTTGHNDGSPNGDGSVQALLLLSKPNAGFTAKRLVRDDRNTILGLSLENLVLGQETSGPGTDEVYMITVTADISNRFAPPRIRTRMTGPWSAVQLDNGGLTNLTLKLFPWGIAEANGAVLSEAIPRAADVIFLAALVENDEEDPNAVRTRVAGMAFAELASSLANNDDRATIASHLAETIEGAIKQSDMAPGFLADDFMDVDEIQFSQAQVEKARRGEFTAITTTLKGDGGSYKATFRLDRTIDL